MLERQKGGPYPVVQFAWRRQGDFLLTRCEYEAADLIIGLHEDDVEWLDSIRPFLHEIKNRTLLEMSAALLSGKANRLWERVVAILAGRLNAEQVQKLLRIDTKYLGYNALNGTSVPGRTPYVPGGLSTIVELAGFVEKELEIGPLHRTREALGGLVAGLARSASNRRAKATLLGVGGGETEEAWAPR
ncbi:MAG: hypothetical protein WKF75_11340 [Singulisphaera sp.]